MPKFTKSKNAGNTTFGTRSSSANEWVSDKKDFVDNMDCVTMRDNHLIFGFMRQTLKHKIIPFIIAKTISEFYPKLNGTSFIWNVRDISNKIKNKNDESMQMSMNNIQTIIESDTFYVNLGSFKKKFWLSLCSESIQSDNLYDVALNLCTFPLSSKYKFGLFEYKLFCYQTNTSYSKIYKLKPASATIPIDDNQMVQYPPIIDTNIKFPYRIPFAVGTNLTNNLTFECNINILQLFPVGFKEKKPKKSGRGYWTPPGYNKDDENSKCIAKAYQYESRGNIYGKLMEFKWKLLYYDHDNVILSDIYYDLFQFEWTKYKQLQLSICSLPQNTKKMAVKMDMNVNDLCVLSNILTFSFEKPTVIFSTKLSGFIENLLKQNKYVQIKCNAKIVQKYDIDGCIINDSQNVKVANKIKLNEFIKLKYDTFIWHIDGKSDLMKDIRNCLKSKHDFGTFHSDIFVLHGSYKFYIEINKYLSNNDDHYGTVPKINDNLLIYLRHFEYDSTHSQIYIKFIQTGNECKYNTILGQYYDKKEPYLTANCLIQNLSDLNGLNEITIKVIVGIAEQKDDKEKEEFKKWLFDIVGLGQYWQCFIDEGINSLKIVKYLSVDDLWIMGINKIGHQLKLMSYIKKL